MLRRATSRKPLWLVTAAQTLGRLRLCSHFADEAAAALGLGLGLGLDPFSA